MKSYFIKLFCWHKWEHTFTDKKAINIIHTPVHHYKCKKCGATKTKARWEI